MKILVCGGRNLRDETGVFHHLDKMLDAAAVEHFPVTCVVTGAASGADLLAEKWARSREIAYRGHPAPWHQHGDWCRCHPQHSRVEHVAAVHEALPVICNGAGMWRNAEMLRREHVASFPVSLCVAFPGGAGTAGMVRLVKERGILVREIALAGTEQQRGW